MGDKLSILIISYYFAPQNTIGAVRATKFAKYLSRMGHKVTVVCGEGIAQMKDPTLARDLIELNDVCVVREWNPIRMYKKKKDPFVAAGFEQKVESTHVSTARQTKGMKWWIKDKVYLTLLYWADLSFSRRGLREIRRFNGQYDVVLSSYGPWSSHHIGRKVKEMGIAKRWIADFRDPVAYPLFTNASYINRYLKRVKRTVDGVCAVSTGFLASTGIDKNGKVFSNGFDYEDLEGIKSKGHKDHTRLSFTYCGQIHLGERDLSPFFNSLHVLIQEGVCSLEDVHVVYAGADGTALRSQAGPAGMESIICEVGLINREQSLLLQKEADVLVMASRNLKERPGWLTGKLLEYLMMGKPIICIMGGDAMNSETKQLLSTTGAGFCYEQANQEEDQKRLAAYLRQLIAWKHNGETLAAERNVLAIEQYAYSNIVSCFEQWLTSDILG